MASEESPEAKFDRLKKLLQDSILRDYSNPERKGCSGDAILKRLAEKPWDEAIENDPHWQHITHCSECYREFLDFNNAYRQHVKTSKARVITTVAVAAVVVVLALLTVLPRGSLLSKRPQNAELAYVKRTVNIPSMQRSAGGEALQPLLLERRPLELTVELPVGSKAGRYEVQFKNESRTLLSTASEAGTKDGTTSFVVNANLSEFEPGNYSIVVRQVPFGWNYYPVLIR